MRTNFTTGTGDFTTRFCVGGTLAEAVAVVYYAEVEDVTADGVVENSGVEGDDVLVMFRV